MDNLLQSIEAFPPSSQLPVLAPLPDGVMARDSCEGITLDEFLTGAGTGEDTGEVRRRKRGVAEINGVGTKEADCPTQREKRILKNRESAARSRERKQAYTLELESLAAKLEEENSRLLAQQMELGQMRLKQLLENIIPITEKKRPHPSLRRTRSLEF